MLASLPWSMVETIFGRGRGGGGASIRHGAFIRGEFLIQISFLKEGAY